jgi:formiminotetrahydrofolate cyclodeaminase
VLAVGGINATILSNMVAAFDSGKDFSAKQAEVQKQVEEVRMMVKELREEREQQKSSRN